ncbi:MAG: sigma 54-interacting transcriptional regulator [Planctomycetes bacterium]|nr:sigma 54-interacting transcriptional regulator [Planctomycetota bacterium]
MKRQKLSDYLESIKSFKGKQNWLKTKRLCEVALKKLPVFSYSFLEEYTLYCYLGDACSYLAEYSSSLEAYYKAHYIASKHHFKPALLAQVSLLLGYSLLRIINIKQALTQLHKVDQYYQKYGDSIAPMDKANRIYYLVGLAYCYLYQDDLVKAREVIEEKIPSHLEEISNEYLLLGYHHLKGEYLITIRRYAEARQSFEEYLRVNRELISPKGELETRIHLAQIELLQNKVDSTIRILQAILKDSRRLRFYDHTCESALLLSRCYLLKGLPDKAATIERRIKPILSTLDTVWLYEKTREFEKFFRQLQDTVLLPRLQGEYIPEILTHTFNHRHETSPYKDIIIGSSIIMNEVYQLIEKIAPTDLPILIQGETGTGKELIARAIHRMSHRGNKPYLAINCGAIPESLMESELFGHNRGAFTGAEADKKGYIELASGGTLFIDEIASMSAGMQQKLLRVLEENLVWRIGAQKQVAVNTRFLFACNQDIEQMVKRKLFREDLFYRINTIIVDLPPLRDRKEDIPLLVQHFFKKYGQGKMKAEMGSPSEIRISQSAIDLLTAYPWSGNIRELENEIQRICVLYPDAKLITESMLSTPMRDYPLMSSSLQGKTTIKNLTASFQRNIIVETLKKYNGDIKLICGHLGYARSGLYKKLKELKIDHKFITQK